MKVIENKLSKVPVISSDTNKLDIPYSPMSPLPQAGSLYICGSPNSGKTNLLLSFLLSHPTKRKPTTPRYYYKYFDRINIISGSLQTLPLKKLGLPLDQLDNKYTDAVLSDIIEDMQEGENVNNLIILDDCIRDLTRSKILTKCVLNRRHCVHNNEEEGQGSLSMWITSQKFNMLPLSMRTNMSHIILFKTTNQSELTAIRDELMGDLTKYQQDELFDFVWDEKHNFIFIDVFAQKSNRYYKNFSKIIF